jgi:hypothetical protein
MLLHQNQDLITAPWCMNMNSEVDTQCLGFRVALWQRGVRQETRAKTQEAKVLINVSGFHHKVPYIMGRRPASNNLVN